MPQETLTDLCKRLEHFETPHWAARAILKKEILTSTILDPCCGAGILAHAAKEFYPFPAANIWCFDIHDWGFEGCNIANFLTPEFKINPIFFERDGFTVFMNPPFSLAEKFVEKSFELGARKIICFQRFAWWESQKRRDFWRAHPPARVYICGDRADCWRHDIPLGQRKSSTPTAHAWFVWESGQSGPPILGHIYKD